MVTNVNDTIKAREMMVITDSGEQLGVLSLEEALEMAESKDLDLVLVAPGAKPPVAKFMDYSKYKYDMQRKQREAKKKQATTSLKEIRLSPKIEKHDLETKLKNGRKFLEKGNKLKLSIRFRGREMAHTDRGRTVMLDFAESCKDLADIETRPKKEGRNMHMVLSPIKKSN